MTVQILEKIKKLIDDQNLDQAQTELAKLGPKFYKDVEYLFLRSRVFYLQKLYYLSIDTLFSAQEYNDSKHDDIFKLLSNIYNELDNKEVSKKLLNKKTRMEVVNDIKDNLTGFKKNLYYK